MTPEELAEWNRTHGGLGQVTQTQVGVPGRQSSFDAYGYAPDANGSQLAGGRGQAMQDYSQDQASRADNERYFYNQDVNSSRGQQSNALGLLASAANGNAPSRAEMFGRQQMDQAASGQQSLAASARGPAALAMAQQQAAGNTARAQTDITNSSMQMRADEMARARDAYMSGASGMRGQDQQRVDAAGQRQQGFMNTGLGYAGLEAQGRANDAGLGLNAWKASNDARENAMAREYGYVQNQKRNDAATAGTVMQTAGSVAGAAMMSDVRTKENVQPVNPHAMEEYLATLQPASYQYNGAGGTPQAVTQTGPASAQAIAGTQVGQSVVEQRPDGLLSISAPGAIKAGMAADAHINDKATAANQKADAIIAMLTHANANPHADATSAALANVKPVAGGRYDTPLGDQDEAAFQKWRKKNVASFDSGEDYDFRGAYKAGIKSDPNSHHWPDTFKKPNHETFSDESQYAKDAPDLAGHWDGDKYIPNPNRAKGLASLTTAPTVVSAQPKRDWLMEQLASINATNNVRGPR